MTAEIEPTEVVAELIEEERDLSGRELLIGTIDGLRNSLARIQQPLRRDVLADGWIAALREGGWRATHGKKWNGRYMGDLPFVISLPCPFGHPDEEDSDFASVLLIVREDGWPYFNPETKGQCSYCTATMLERWLLDCARCERGENSTRHTPGHLKGDKQLRVRTEAGYQIVGDVSPISFVTYEFERMSDLARARHWVEHGEQAATEYRESHGYDQAGSFSRDLIEGKIERQIERARRLLATPVLKAPSAEPDKKEWTHEQSVAFLDELRSEEGELIVPLKMSANKAWETLSPLEDRPSRHQIMAAQMERKSRPTTE